MNISSKTKGIHYCCPLFKQSVKRKKIKYWKIGWISHWRIPYLFEVQYCPICGQRGCSHSNFTVAQNSKDYSTTNKKNMSKNKYCCWRFAESVKEGEFIYAYQHGKEIDETQWFIAGIGHLYYCPYCGSYIKGRGFGIVPKPYKKRNSGTKH